MHIASRLCFDYHRTMKEGPDIALLGSLIGDPARANMLTALMSGKALTASELASEASITAQTASTHLKKLEAGGLITPRKQGRHRYFTLTDDDVGALLENMMGLAAKKGHIRVRTGPKDPALRKARVCYNHLAGDMGVRILDSFVERDFIADHDDTLTLTDRGYDFIHRIGISSSPKLSSRRPLCRSCLDWSERRSHLAGILGTQLLDLFYDKEWARRDDGSRIVTFTNKGEKAFLDLFPLTKNV